MFKRIPKLPITLTVPANGDANAAAAVQELLGGKFGEMSTLNNYMYQSNNFRNKKKLRPFYDLVASITAEEFGHVELVTNTINLLTRGTTTPGAPDTTPLQNGLNKRLSHHFIVNAQTALAADSQGRAWTGDNVFNSGNLVLDLLHNFFLEIGARTHKMRVYEMTDQQTAREMIGYLLVRGGTHVMAYAKAIEIATGVDMMKMLPVPDLSNDCFDAARPYIAQGLSNVLYTWSDGEYQSIRYIWKGINPDTNQPFEVIEGTPEGGPIPDLDDIPEEFAPGIDRDMYEQIARRLMQNM